MIKLAAATMIRLALLVMRITSKLAALFLLVWVAGFVWFAEVTSHQQPPETYQSEALVVLTGGAGRIALALELLKQNAAPQLYISGVIEKISRDELLAKAAPNVDVPRNLRACCITLDYLADSTISNASVTAAWLAERQIKSITLVTHYYHMPRALLEFHRALPATITLTPYPLVAEAPNWWQHPANWPLLALEYSKYLGALARTSVARLQD